MSRRILEWLQKRLFAPAVTTTITYTNIPPEKRAAFDRAFRKMDEAFSELDEVFKS